MESALSLVSCTEAVAVTLLDADPGLAIITGEVEPAGFEMVSEDFTSVLFSDDAADCSDLSLEKFLIWLRLLSIILLS